MNTDGKKSYEIFNYNLKLLVKKCDLYSTKNFTLIVSFEEKMLFSIAKTHSLQSIQTYRLSGDYHRCDLLNKNKVLFIPKNAKKYLCVLNLNKNNSVKAHNFTEKVYHSMGNGNHIYFFTEKGLHKLNTKSGEITDIFLDEIDPEKSKLFVDEYVLIVHCFKKNKTYFNIIWFLKNNSDDPCEFTDFGNDHLKRRGNYLISVNNKTCAMIADLCFDYAKNFNFEQEIQDIELCDQFLIVSTTLKIHIRNLYLNQNTEISHNFVNLTLLSVNSLLVGITSSGLFKIDYRQGEMPLLVHLKDQSKIVFDQKSLIKITEKTGQLNVWKSPPVKRNNKRT